MAPTQNPGDPNKPEKKSKAKTNKGWENLNIEVEGDEVLLELTGLASATRAQYVQAIWAYIKDNKLQSARDGRMIVPDEKLAKLTGRDEISAFSMPTYIERHLKKKEELPEPFEPAVEYELDPDDRAAIEKALDDWFGKKDASESAWRLINVQHCDQLIKNQLFGLTQNYFLIALLVFVKKKMK